uniref:Uncharacterized protein n=1 Tax=Myotis lucifugus TaxID=59463 RepID=G1QAK5_MYOLU
PQQDCAPPPPSSWAPRWRLRARGPGGGGGGGSETQESQAEGCSSYSAALGWVLGSGEVDTAGGSHATHNTEEERQEGGGGWGRRRLQREYSWKIINAFRYYGTSMHQRVNRTERQFRSLPANQQKLLPQFLLHLDKIRKYIDHNQGKLLTIVNDCIHMFENKEYGQNGNGKIMSTSTF